MQTDIKGRALVNRDNNVFDAGVLPVRCEHKASLQHELQQPVDHEREYWYNSRRFPSCQMRSTEEIILDKVDGITRSQ